MRTKDLSYWLFLAPVLLALSMVVILPLCLGIYYSFTNWNGIETGGFIGFENYINVFSDKKFMDAMWFTVKFSVVSIILINLIGLSLALIVTSRIKSSNFLRTIFFMPNLIGGLILGFIWQFIFMKVFDGIGSLMGVESLQGWLSTTETGFWGLVILMSWQMSGYIMVIYIAYLEGVPHELLEAAEIDGASPFQRLRYIVLPLVAPAFTVSMFLTLSNTFKLYDQNLSLTAGGPYNSTQMVAMEIFKTAFVELNMSYAQAKAVIFFIIVAAISLTQVYINKKREVEL
ncbi:sugar ABC transporter permease [Neobacillus piezotolerans]|uniref:Sugar ABC transporter permease n=1 Tax=Neobacillus piezotolerans TaxID=2259171 RepID=A0A3D8GU19_9BACI|nr:sugar ABC transporter permease [Neobacillus piezotolerans]RDU37953.1 sugar ABC transporter permease [Neobacillus piezotolerans]